MVKAAVVLLGHGSQRGSSTDLGLREITRRLRAYFTAETPVREAFFEFLHPTIEETIAALVAGGTERVVVMPYFLFDGKEIKFDIPHELDHVRQLFPGLELHQAKNLGIDAQLIEMVAERVKKALAGVGQLQPTAGCFPVKGETGRLGVIVINRGSRKQYDSGERLLELVGLVRQQLGGDTLVEPAQAENSPVTIATAARKLVEAGAQRVVAMPYLNFPGKVLADNIVPDLQKCRQEHRAVKFYLAQTLCVDDRLVDLCYRRVLESGLVPADSLLTRRSPIPLS